MGSNVSRRRVLAGGGLGILASLAGCLATGRGETEIVTETYGTDDYSAISLSGENGSVTVEGGRGTDRGSRSQGSPDRRHPRVADG